MSYFENYKQLLPYYELYLNNFIKSLKGLDYNEIIALYDQQESLTEDEQRLYAMCKLVSLLEVVVNCLQTEQKDKFDLVEPELYDWIQWLKEDTSGYQFDA